MIISKNLMIISRYSILYYSENSYKLFNTRTNFCAIISKELYNTLSLLKECDFNLESLNIPHNTLMHLIKGKVIVNPHEDEDYYNLKKYLRYNQAFSRASLGLIIVPTLACNFKCPYCYETNLTSKNMSVSTMDQILRFVKNTGCKTVNLCWHGGEPLLAFEQIHYLLNKLYDIQDLKMKTHSMVTNGFLLDPDKCKILSQYNIGHIQITIDGNRDFHNRSRRHKLGIPTFDIILENIENVFTYIPSCHVTVRVNLREENKYQFPSLYKNLRQRWKGQNYSVDLAFVNDVNSSCNVACLPNRGKVSLLKELSKKFGIDDIQTTIAPQVGGCTATCVNSVIIGPEGEIYKCWVDVGKPQKVVDSIFENKVRNYILPSYIVGADMFSDRKCHDCAFLPICDGGCVVRRYNKLHDGADYDPCPLSEEDFYTLLDMYIKQKCK